MKFLITGGAGFIGSHLAEALIARGEEVFVIDDLSTGTIENIIALKGCKNVQRYLQFFGIKVSNEFLLRGHTINTLVRSYGVIVIDKSPQLSLAMF